MKSLLGAYAVFVRGWCIAGTGCVDADNVRNCSCRKTTHTLRVVVDENYHSFSFYTEEDLVRPPPAEVNWIGPLSCASKKESVIVSMVNFYVLQR